MDELGRSKRRHYVTAILVSTALLLRTMLANLDDIRLAHHTGDDARDRIAEDLMMVYAHILPTVDAPPEVLGAFQLFLMDWVNLDSLLDADSIIPLSPARAEAMELLAGKMATNMTMARDAWPGLFGMDG